MNFLFVVLPVLIVFLLDKQFKLKAKLIKKFKTVRRYNLTMFVVTIVPILVYGWLNNFSNDSFKFEMYSVLFLYYFLIYIPKELR
ncbi:uncharacterized protein YqhQ [Brassicibacter mesophilus]